MDLPVVWIDTETTGLDPERADIVEIAAIYRVDAEDVFQQITSFMTDKPQYRPLWTVPGCNLERVHEVLEAYDIDPASVSVFYRKVKPDRLHLAEEEAMKINGYDAELWAQEAVRVGEMLLALSEWVPRRKRHSPWAGGYHVRLDLGLLEAAAWRVEGMRVPFHRTVEIETLIWDKLRIPPEAKLRFHDIAPVLGVSQHGIHTALADAVRAMVVGEKLHGASWVQRKWWSRKILQNCQKTSG